MTEHEQRRLYVLMLDDGSLGLIDFGITGRLDSYERSAVFEVLLAMRLEQPALLYDALMTRLPHTSQPVTADERAAIATAATRPGVEPGWILDERRAEATELAIQAMTVEVNGHDTYEEANLWFRFSDAEVAAEGDGLNAYTTGITGLSLLALRTITRPGN